MSMIDVYNFEHDEGNRTKNEAYFP
jgi:hypothetical protein